MVVHNRISKRVNSNYDRETSKLNKPRVRNKRKMSPIYIFLNIEISVHEIKAVSYPSMGS